MGKGHPGRWPSRHGFAGVELGEDIKGPSQESWHLKV